MSKKIYRTAQGKQVNIEALRLTNESTIAVGNMGVNARGDEVDARGQVVKPKNQIMKEYYSAEVGNRTGSFTDKVVQERERARQEREKLNKQKG
jgi:hypothetical protein